MHMKLKFGLRAKFIVLFLVFSVVISLAAKYITQWRYEITIVEQYERNAIVIANLAVSFIDGDKFEEYGSMSQKDDEYETMQDTLNHIRENAEVEYLYALMPISDQQLIYIFDTWVSDTPEDSIGQLGEQVPYDPSLPGISTAMETGKTNDRFEVTSITEYGCNATIYAPVKNSRGQPVGVLGVDIAMNNINETIDAAVVSLIGVMIIIIAACFLVLLFIVQTSFIHPVRVLKLCVEEMAYGKLGVQAPIRGNNEITEISRVFNQMSLNISFHMNEITELSNGYYKFVPLQIFEILQKTDITQIRLGDSHESVLSILSMQINDFGKLAEKMETRVLFAFINQVYQEAVPCIQQKDGVIGEYYKDGFTAFYQDSAQKVLDSAIIICQHFNIVKKPPADREYLHPRLGFGISHGSVMLGIVGNENRLSTAMLSEHITAAEYLKEIAWKYRAHILVTGTAAAQIADFSNQYSSRLIGLLYFKASGKTEKFYDVYNGDSVADMELKDLTKEKFEEGVKKFLDRQFYAARLCFIEVLKVYRLDYASREYLYLCNRYYQLEDGGEEIVTYLEAC